MNICWFGNKKDNGNVSNQIIHKFTSVSMLRAPHIYLILTKFEFSGQILLKHPAIKIQRRSAQWERSCCVRTDRQAGR